MFVFLGIAAGGLIGLGAIILWLSIAALFNTAMPSDQQLAGLFGLFIVITPAGLGAAYLWEEFRS